MTHGIYCVEGAWSAKVTDKASVLPMLEILGNGSPDLKNGISFFHTRVSTIAELRHHLKKWAALKNGTMPILYLSTHGEPGKLKFGDELFSIDQLWRALQGKCAGRVIMLGSCSTLKIEQESLQRLLDETGAAVVMGYNTNVNWINSTAFELILFNTLQENALSGTGPRAIERKTKKWAKAFGEELGFIVLIKGGK